MSDILKIGKYEFNSRLIVGSGKYKDFQTTKDATIASGSELITVAIRSSCMPEKRQLRFQQQFTVTI